MYYYDDYPLFEAFTLTYGFLSLLLNIKVKLVRHVATFNCIIPTMNIYESIFINVVSLSLSPCSNWRKLLNQLRGVFKY